MDARILLVDDSQELLNAYLAFLKATTPYEVRAASSGGAALQVLRTWRPDVVVTDLIMPGMNGLELITHMRSELAPPLPLIIAMSGFPTSRPRPDVAGRRSSRPSRSTPTISSP